MSYLELLYNRLAEILTIDNLPNTDKRADDYGEALSTMSNTLWTHYNNADKVDGVAYISEMDYDKNIIHIYYMYWIKWAHLPVTRKNVNAVAGWSRRCTSAGLPISVEVVANDDIYNPQVTINIQDRGNTAICQLCAKDESIFYINENNEECCYKSWLGSSGLITYDYDVSHMEHGALIELIKYIIRAVKHLYYEAIGAGDEYNDYEDDVD